MHSAVRALPATVTDLVLDLASTPLPELLSGDLVGSVCAEVADTLGVAGAACLTRPSDRTEPDRLVVAGWSDPRAWSLARLQAEQQQGPAVCALTDGRTVVQGDLHRLPRDPHTARALVLQVRATVATPLRSADTVLGALQLYLDDPQPPAGELVAGAESLARVLGAITANVDLYRRSAEMTAHLAEVLTSRAPVEQAKGALAERHRIGVGEAFGLLRTQARRRRVPVTAVAREVLAAVPHPSSTPLPDVPPRPARGEEADGALPRVAPAPPLRAAADQHRPVRTSRRPPAREALTTPSDAQHPLRDASSRPQVPWSTDPATA
jgi:hypothetical protein